MNFLIIGTDTIDNIFLKEIIEKFPGLKLKEKFDKLNDANEIIKSEKIDFVLLSSNIIEALNYSNSYFEKIEVILITNKSYDAITSYTHGFIDCLLKPISIDRFKKTLSRVRKKITESKLVNKNSDKKIVIKTDRKLQKIKLGEIYWLEAMGDYIKIFTKKKEYIVLSTMKSFIKKLPDEFFFRIHKSFIINLNCIEYYTSDHLRINGKLIPISRYKKKDFLKKFYAVNTDQRQY